jgi:hypothetical protein
MYSLSELIWLGVGVWILLIVALGWLNYRAGLARQAAKRAEEAALRDRRLEAFLEGGPWSRDATRRF